jgi:hypothetical protein
MLQIVTGSPRRDCGQATRREFLQIGTLGLGGLTLPGLLSARAQAAAVGKSVKDTSIVLLFLTGGPSQIETFDPKMTAPAIADQAANSRFSHQWKREGTAPTRHS